MEANEIALVIIFAVAIAAIVEGVKYFDKSSVLTAKQIELLTMILGIVMGLGARYTTGMELYEAVSIGLTGTFVSTRVYESAKNWLGIKSEENI